MIKRSLACLLAAILLLCTLTACAKQENGVPDGMKSATLSGEPFMLYVPEAWSLNTSSGISGAYYNSAQTILVSARYYTPKDPSMTLDAYVDLCSSLNASSQSNYTITAREPAILGGTDAVRLSYTIKQGGDTLTCFQIATRHGEDFVSLYGYCASNLYDMRRADFDAIIKEFVLCEKSAPQGTPVIDKKTPDGFQVASSDQVEYRLYVPTNWICDAESGASEAYYPESGRSNVSVTSYAPTVSTDIKGYFLSCEETYRATLPGYRRPEGEPVSRKVADRTAYSYTYYVTVDGVELTIMQTLFIYNEMIYSFTYTALSENFALHLADVNAMLDVFTFR